MGSTADAWKDSGALDGAVEELKKTQILCGMEEPCFLSEFLL